MGSSQVGEGPVAHVLCQWFWLSEGAERRHAYPSETSRATQLRVTQRLHGNARQCMVLPGSKWQQHHGSSQTNAFVCQHQHLPLCTPSRWREEACHAYSFEWQNRSSTCGFPSALWFLSQGRRWPTQQLWREGPIWREVDDCCHGFFLQGLHKWS